MTSKFRQRLAGDESGFTLIELFVVAIILGILLVITVASYLSYRDHEDSSTARANVLAAIPAIKAYKAANSGNGFAGMTVSYLRDHYDSDLVTTKLSFPKPPTSRTYCVESTVGGNTWRENGPGQPVEHEAC
jgi:prepilin-type N-terminal cleavage/methylation domain-containing protein